MVARRKAGAAGRAGQDNPVRDGPVSPAQRDHARAVLARFRLAAPEGALEDARWVGNLLDVFSFDAETGQGGYRAVRSLVLRCAEGCDDTHVARVIGVSAEAVRQAVDMLRAAGYALDPVEDDPALDPEDEVYARQEGLDPAPVAQTGLTALLALCAPDAVAPEPPPPPAAAQRVPALPPRTAAAWRFLAGADFSTRRRWSERARQRGIALPPAAAAKENLHLWIDAVAAELVAEERLKDAP